LHIDSGIMQPTTKSTLMTLSKHRTAADINRPFGEVDTFATDPSNHHPDQGLAMTVVCPGDRLTQ
jgi:hypothetical protein